MSPKKAEDPGWAEIRYMIVFRTNQPVALQLARMAVERAGLTNKHGKSAWHYVNATKPYVDDGFKVAKEFTFSCSRQPLADEGAKIAAWINMWQGMKPPQKDPTWGLN